MQRTADLSRLPRDTGERRDLTLGRDFAARNFCDDPIDAGVRRHFLPFLPSFLFILCGAPLVEAPHDDLKFTAPLSGIPAGSSSTWRSSSPGTCCGPAGTAPFASYPELGWIGPNGLFPPRAGARIPAGLPMLTVPVANQR
jgi:hypothetical protein